MKGLIQLCTYLLFYYFESNNGAVHSYKHADFFAKKLRAKILLASFLDFLPIQKDDTASFDKIFIMCL